MTDKNHAATIADASRKLHTVLQILTEIDATGVHDVKIELVKALLQPTKEALNIR